MSTEIVDTCYKFLKPKRKPRSIIELYTQFVIEGYLLFSEKDLLDAIQNDERFEVNDSENELFAEVSVIRKKKS